MEVAQLKERASQLVCQGRHSTAPTFDHLNNPKTIGTEHSIDTLTPEPEERGVEIFPGRLPMNSALVFVLVSILISLAPTAMGQSQDMSKPESAESGDIARSAQRVYLDPRTGRVLREPPSGAQVLTLSPAELNMISTSHKGLVERSLPGGGYMLDLQGRFRNMAVATVAGDGTVVIHEVAGEAFLPVDSEQSEENENNE